MSMYLAILSRVLLASHAVFSETLSVMAQQYSQNEQDILANIIDVWTVKMCYVSQEEQRKLLGLALTNLLTTQSRPILERFGSIMVNILEALNDISKEDENGVIMDSLVLTEGRSPSYFHEDSDRYYETDHDQRKKQLIISDPVHNIILKDYLQSQVRFLF